MPPDRTRGAPDGRCRSLLLTLLLVVSALAFIPLALPTAQATPYPGPEPTPTTLTVFLHNSSFAQPITGGIFSSNLLTSDNYSTPQWRSTGALTTGIHFLDAQFYLFPRAAGPLTLNGTPVANIFVNQTGSVRAVTWTFTLSAIDTTGAPHVLGTPGSATTNLDDGSLGTPLRIPYGSSLLTTLPAGWSLLADFNQYTSGATADGYGFWWGHYQGTYYGANVGLPASTYLAVNQTYTVGPGGTVVASLNQSARTPVVSFRANVSDPLGNYDYTNWSVNWTVTDASGSLFGAGPMVPLGPSVPPNPYAYNETYRSASTYNYSWLPPGSYTLCAHATDNTAHNDALFTGNYGRAASGCSSFVVGLLPVPVHVHVIDTAGSSLLGAHVVGAPAGARGPAVASGITDASGETTLLLPGGASYALNLYWEQVWAGVFNLTLGASEKAGWANATALVFSPTFHFQDSSGRAVPFPLVFVHHPNGTDLPLAVANGGGNLPLTQVPLGAYGLNVVYDDVAVLSGASAFVAHGGLVNVTVPSVYLLTVDTRTSTGAALDGVFVQVINSATGATVASGYSSGGSFSALVPAGSYEVNGTFETTYDLTAISQSVSQAVSVSTADATVTLTFSKAYPSFFQTTLFTIGMAIGGLVVLLVLALVWGIKRGKKRSGGSPPAPDRHPPATGEPVPPSAPPAPESKS